MNKQVNIWYSVLAVVIIAGLSFYGGMSYAKSSGRMMAQGQFGTNGQARGAFGQGQAGAAAGGTTGAGAAARGRGGNAVMGSVLSKDAQSFTMKLPTGGSQIVLLSGSTTVLKTTEGSLNDISTGTTLVVTGTTNSDGSLTAQSVQIRPAGANPAGAPGTQGGPQATAPAPTR